MNREITGTALDQEIHVKHLPATAWWRSSRWELLKEYVSHNKSTTVPIGFISDGATIPFFLRGHFSPTGKYFGAAIVHDYYIDIHDDWKKANKEFEKEMEALNVVAWQRIPMVWGVEIWGSIRKWFPKSRNN